ncbi:MAG: type II secretion system F family protein [Magnetococcales bacterium]|nr:type II secretion system F family protein [Magnetococcales bacterium]
MPTFRFKAMDLDGKLIRDQMEADNEADAEGRLARMQMDVIQLKEIKSSTAKWGAKKLDRREMITFCFHMEQMVIAGVPIIEGLSDLRDAGSRQLQVLLNGMLDEIGGGKTLTQAMESYPKVFDEVFISLVRAGESSGNLGEIFANLTEDLKWQDEMAARTKKLMLYPSIMGTVMVGVFFFMMTFLVPQLVSFMKIMDFELPIYSIALMKTSDFVVAYWAYLLGIPIGIVMLIQVLKRISSRFLESYDGFKLRVWIFGPILNKLILARFANIFGLLYASGISVLDCLAIGRRVAGNQRMERVLEEIGERVRGGEDIAGSFEKALIFPRLVVRMISVGERTGALDTSLKNVRYFYDRDVREAVDRLQGMIEPGLTAFVGILMIWVVVSVLGPIYDIMQNMRY